MFIDPNGRITGSYFQKVYDLYALMAVHFQVFAQKIKISLNRMLSNERSYISSQDRVIHMVVYFTVHDRILYQLIFRLTIPRPVNAYFAEFGGLWRCLNL